MAVATPARLPVPTREAMETAKASKEETCFVGLLRGVAQETDHLAYHAELHTTRLDSEQHGAAYEQGYKNVSPQHVVDTCDNGVEPAVSRKKSVISPTQ